MQQSQLIIVSRVRFGEEFFVVKIDTESHCAEELAGSPVAVPVEGVHEGAETGQDGLGEPLIGLLVVFFGADFVTFLSFFEYSFVRA